MVLLTPDDEARLRKPFWSDNDESYERRLTPQARPNVLFEAGMAMGRSPERTVVVQVGNVRPFSDFAGRHVIHLDNSTEKRQQFAQRLQNAGCPANLEGTDWHSIGDFGVVTPSSQEEMLDCEWGRSGDVWWLQGDLSATLTWLRTGSKYDIDNGLKRSYFHATRLQLTDDGILERLERLMNEAKGISQDEWTDPKRNEYFDKVLRILGDAGPIIQKKQPNFKPDPD